ncbi:sugar transferase [Acidobacteriota bacterium]
MVTKKLTPVHDSSAELKRVVDSIHELRLARGSSLRAQLLLKRLFDVLGASLLILLFSPLFLLIAFLVKLSSKGPVIYSQDRVGLNGKLFSFLKFRTMLVNSGNGGSNEETELREQGIILKKRNDPRITPIGAVLRRTSIDELPQLFSVLKGDMSLVGPRPLVPWMLTPFQEFMQHRSVMRPGITGLWQIRWRDHNSSAKDMMRHDMFYIKRFSLWLDIKILLGTPGATISGKGAV